MLTKDAVEKWKLAIAGFNERIVSEFCKKAACMLIDASEGATKRVRLVTKNKEFGKLIERGGHDMNLEANDQATKPHRGTAYLGSSSTPQCISGKDFCLFLDTEGPFVNCDGDNYTDIPFDPTVINSYRLPG